MSRPRPTLLLIAVLLAACTSTTTPTAIPAPTPPTASGSATPAAAATVPAQPPTSPAATDAPGATVAPTAPGSPGAVPGDELVMPGALTACIARVGAPASDVTVEGDFDGYNVAFAREIASRMGLSLQIEQPVFEDLIGQLEAHACDISVSSQNITASRLERIHMLPYTQSIQPVLVEVGNPRAVDSLEALCGLAVSATSGTTHVDLVNGTGDYAGAGLNDACREEGREQIDLRPYESEIEAVTALLEGEVAAYLGNPSFVFDYPTEIVYSQATLPPARQGIGIALDRPGIRAAVEAALAQMIADGTYHEILLEYLPNDESVDVVSIAD